jgi:hypothetical protein
LQISNWRIKVYTKMVPCSKIETHIQNCISFASLDFFCVVKGYRICSTSLIMGWSKFHTSSDIPTFLLCLWFLEGFRRLKVKSVHYRYWIQGWLIHEKCTFPVWVHQWYIEFSLGLSDSSCHNWFSRFWFEIWLKS